MCPHECCPFGSPRAAEGRRCPGGYQRTSALEGIINQGSCPGRPEPLAWFSFPSRLPPAPQETGSAPRGRAGKGERLSGISASVRRFLATSARRRAAVPREELGLKTGRALHPTEATFPDLKPLAGRRPRGRGRGGRPGWARVTLGGQDAASLARLQPPRRPSQRKGGSRPANSADRGLRGGAESVPSAGRPARPARFPPPRVSGCGEGSAPFHSRRAVGQLGSAP